MGGWEAAGPINFDPQSEEHFVEGGEVSVKEKFTYPLCLSFTAHTEHFISDPFITS